jgi:hypothetical protein
MTSLYTKRMFPSPYHLVLQRAQAVFQRRLNELEIELAEARDRLARIDLADPDRGVAIAMACHARLGRDSVLQELPVDIVREIGRQADSM